MSLIGTYQQIERAMRQGRADNAAGYPRKTDFEFPNEQRAYDEGYDAQQRERESIEKTGHI